MDFGLLIKLDWLIKYDPTRPTRSTRPNTTQHDPTRPDQPSDRPTERPTDRQFPVQCKTFLRMHVGLPEFGLTARSVGQPAAETRILR